MTKKPQIVVVPRTNVSTTNPVRAIYSELTDKIIDALGDKETNRASHVEPSEELTDAAKAWLREHDTPEKWLTSSNWWADMIPSGGPVLGPFKHRDEALREEVKWLHANGIPVCEACTESPTKNPNDNSHGPSSPPS